MIDKSEYVKGIEEQLDKNVFDAQQTVREQAVEVAKDVFEKIVRPWLEENGYRFGQDPEYDEWVIYGKDGKSLEAKDFEYPRARMVFTALNILIPNDGRCLGDIMPSYNM